MSNRFPNPDITFVDETGLPYAGGTLSFYSSGTSTPLNTYSDSALTVANTNPVVLDSAGRAGAIFLLNQQYKVILKDVNGVQIFTQDPVSTSDTTTTAQFSTYPGDPSGHVAGTQGSGSIPASVVYDTTDNVLYVAITTGTAATTVWFPINTTAQSIIAAPGGYLTPVQGTPALTIDSVAATQIFYSPYSSNVVPIYNGTSFSSLTFTASTSLTLTSLHAVDKIYDIFIFNNSGVATLCTGPAWVDLTANGVTPPRGAGSGTTQITNLNGIWVNSSPLLTPVNGALTLPVIPPLFATYVGSVYTDHTAAGQTTVHVTYGQTRKRGIYNAYNRLPVSLKGGDPAATWTYGTGTWRASNALPATYTIAIANVGGTGTPGNTLCLLDGLGEESLNLRFTQMLILPAAGGGNVSGLMLGIGVNLTTGAAEPTPSGLVAEGRSTGAGGTYQTPQALYQSIPVLGVTTMFGLEKTDGTAGGNPTMTGTETSMVLEAHYRA